MDRRTCLHWASAAVVALAGCSNATSEPATTTPPAADAIEFRDHRYDPTRPAVVGTLQNTGPRTVSIVTVIATFYDADGGALAEWITAVGTIQPGEVVALSAPYPDAESADRVADYELAVDRDETWYV